jgi:DNA-binding MarR family transcriptional regulator
MTTSKPGTPGSKRASAKSKNASGRTNRKARNGRRLAPAVARATTSVLEVPLWARPGYLLRRLHQIHYALFFEECARFDITPVQYGLLSTLAINPDLDQNSLGRELGIDRTNVADVLNRLERRGLLERRRGPNDRRTVLTRLTPAGEQLTKRMYPAMQRAQDRLLKPLLREERNAFVITLIRLIDGNNHLGRAIFDPS